MCYKDTYSHNLKLKLFRMVHISSSDIQDVHPCQEILLNNVTSGAGESVASESVCSDNKCTKISKTYSQM